MCYTIHVIVDKPSDLFLLTLGVFVNLFFLAYLISPKFCHRFVGYLEEEAVKTYTHCLEVDLMQNVLAILIFSL